MQENDIYMSEAQNGVNVEEIQEVAEVTEVYADEIEMTETLAGDSESVNHTHTIMAIEGLYDRLNNIESLKTVSSNGRGFAEYHMWYDGNPNNEDRTGYFVSMVNGTDYIKICTTLDEDIFGVIVSESTAGFVGNQSKEGRDYQYGLVCLIGNVPVRSVKGVAKGDYVIPNALGMAQKTSADVKKTVPYHQTITVTDATFYTLNHAPNIDDIQVYLLNDDGTYGAQLTVIAPQKDGETAIPDGKRIAINDNVISLILGDEGYNEGDKIKFIYTYMTTSGAGYKVVETSVSNGVNYAKINLVPDGNTLARIKDEVNNLSDSVSTISNNVVMAVNTANEALSLGSNGTLTSETLEKLNKVDEIEDTANNAQDIATSARDYAYEAQKKATETTTTAAALYQDAVETANAAWSGVENVEQAIVAMQQTVDQYSVGEYSQAFGLTYQQAKDALVKHYVYVPTVAHTEEYQGEDTNIIQTFSLGYSYTWNGEAWNEVADVTVGGDGSVISTYWYTGVRAITDEDGNILYDDERLYMRQADKWVPVASSKENTLSRVVSIMSQTANAASIGVVDVKGDVAQIDSRVGMTEAKIQSITTWQEDTTSALTTVREQADANEASIVSLTQYSTSITEELDTEQPKGTFYATRPDWKSDDEGGAQWVFANDLSSLDIATNEYCYAENAEDTTTYYKYECNEDNVWSRTKYGASTLATLQQQADANGASIGMVVKDGEVQAQVIVEAINGDGAVKINANNIKFEGQDLDFSMADSISFSTSQYDIIADNIVLDADKINFTAEDYQVIADNIVLDSSDVKIYADNILFESKDGNPMKFDADNINFTATADYSVVAENITLDASQIMLDGEATFTTEDTDGTTKIHGGNIATGTIDTVHLNANAVTADKIATDAITSRNYYTQDENGNYTTTKSGEGMKLNLSDGTFDSENFKIDNDGDVTITGTVHAEKGNIGGFNIGEHTIASGDELTLNDDNTAIVQDGTGNTVGMCSESGLGPWAMWAGEGDFSNKPFRVGHDGSLIALQANIEGNIRASEGAIGGWNITPNAIRDEDYKVSLYSGYEDAYKVDSLCNEGTTSPARLYAGNHITETITKSVSLTSNEYNIVYESEEGKIVTAELIGWRYEGTSTMACTSSSDYTLLKGYEFNTFRTILNADITISSAVIKSQIGNIASINISHTDTGYSINGYATAANTEVRCEVLITYTTKASPILTFTENQVEIVGTIVSSFSNNAQATVDFSIERTSLPKEASFVLLEDGSLYANGANVKGTIYASDGEFTGTINAEQGYIGGLTIQESGISSGVDGLVLLPSGMVQMQKLNVVKDCDIYHIQTNFISAQTDSTYLDFDTGDTVTESETVTFLYEITEQKGTTNWFTGDIEDEGSVTVVITPSLPLKSSQLITVTGHYYYNSEVSGSRSVSTVIETDVSQVTVTLPYLIREKADLGSRTCSFNGVAVAPSSIVQIVGTAGVSSIACGGHFRPGLSDAYNLGSDKRFWNYIYSLNGSSGSDRKIKDNITDINVDFSEQLINGLAPKSYTFKTAKTPRTHYGFVAQDVEELLKSLGTSVDEVGLVCKSLPGEPDSEDNHYSLNYTNLIAPMVSVIQQLSRRVEELENKLDKISTTQND